MSDVIEQLRATNPVAPHALDLLEARVAERPFSLPAPTTAGRRRAWTHSRLTAVVCVVAALAAAPALAFRLGVINFASAPTAPEPVVEQFASLSQGAPPGMDPQALAGQTKLVGTLDGHQLWVSPTEQGGLCEEWSRGGGGCDAAGGWPLSVSWAAAPGDPPTQGHAFGAVDGFAHSRWVDEVQITLGNGTTVRPDVVWVSAPISAGFFYYAAPAGQTISTVSGLRDGKVVAADDLGSGRPQGPHPFADLSKKTEIASLETDDGPAILWSAPTQTDERCPWLAFQRQEIGVVPCLPLAYVHQTAFAWGVHSLGGHQILAGECGYSAVEFVHPDGTTRTVPCNDGLVFADLQPADVAGTLRALDSQGQPLPGSTTRVGGSIGGP